MLDSLLFPFRLIFALLQYLNFFSLNYTGKPLISGRSTRAKQADVRRAAMMGNLASAATEARDEEVEPKLPNDWELRARATDGSERTLARGVLCFNVYSDGGVIWSNGKTVVYEHPDGTTSKLGRFGDVGEVLALERPVE